MKKRLKHLLCLVMAFTVFMESGVCAYADQISDLKKKNQQDQDKLDEIGDQIDELAGEQQGIKGEMDSLQAEIADIMASISLIEEDIQKKKEQIAQSEKDLEAAREDEQNQYNAMIVRIRFMYEKGDMNYINLLMEGGSMEDLMNKADYIEKIYDYDRQLLIRYQETRQKIEDLKAQLEDEESELEMTQDEYKEEQEGMEAAMAELKAVSDDYALQFSKAKQQAEGYKTQIKQQTAQIAKLEEEARKKAEEEARRKAAQNKNNTSTTTTSKPKGTATVNSAEILAANGSDIGKQIAIYACGFVGNPYVPGGTSLTNGADCSGFTLSVYAHFGISLPHSATAQSYYGTEVSLSELEPGDLLFYGTDGDIGHVGIYTGGGMIVHASTEATGIKTSVYNYRTPIKAVRLLGQ